jgi:hypothetical protein
LKLLSLADSNTPKAVTSAPPQIAPSKGTEELPQTTTQELTTFQDEVKPTRVSEPVTRDKVHDPYPPSELEKVCSRVIHLDPIVWTATDARNDTIGTVSLPNDILTKQSMWCRVGRFRYLRSDITVTLKVQGNDMSYGNVLVSVIPDTEQTEVDAMVDTIFKASQLNAKILSPNTTVPLTFDIPYQSQREFWDMKNVSTQEPMAAAALVFKVLNPLQSSSADATPDVSISILANFKNPRIVGPVDIEYTIPTLLPNRVRKNQWYKERKLLLAKHSTKAPVKKKTNPHASAVAQSEAASMISSGVIPDFAARTSALTDKFSSVPIIGGLLDTVETALGFNKPATVAAEQLSIVAPYRNTFNAKGLFNGIVAAQSPNPYVTDAQEVFGVKDLSCCDFGALARKPTLFDIKDVAATTVAGDTITKFHVSPFPAIEMADSVSFADSYIYFASRYFGYWSGSIKYLFHFGCSKFTNTRARITYKPSDDASDANSDGGDVISKVVDIKGDTFTEITVPYLSDMAMKPVYRPSAPVTTLDGAFTIGDITVSLFSNLVTQDATTETPLTVAIFYAAGEDFRLYQPMHPVFQPAAPVAQCDLEDSFAKTFPPIINAKWYHHDHYVSGSSDMSIQSYLHRFRRISGTVNTAYWQASPYPFTEDVDLWSLFRFVRGSQRVRLLRGADITLFGGYTQSHDGTNLIEPTALAGAQKLELSQAVIWSYEVEFPYFCVYRFIKTFDTQLTRNVFITVPVLAGNISSAIYWAAGDDFRFGGRGPTPELTITE